MESHEANCHLMDCDGTRCGGMGYCTCGADVSQYARDLVVLEEYIRTPECLHGVGFTEQDKAANYELRAAISRAKERNIYRVLTVSTLDGITRCKDCNTEKAAIPAFNNAYKETP